MKIATVIKAFKENNVSVINTFASSIMDRVADYPDALTLRPVNEERRKGYAVMYKELEIAFITIPISERSDPAFEINSDWLDFSIERKFYQEDDDENSDAWLIAELFQENVIDDLEDYISTLERHIAAK